jgi:hypothetical protein
MRKDPPFSPPSHHRFYHISLHIVYLYPKFLKFVNQINEEADKTEQQKGDE